MNGSLRLSGLFTLLLLAGWPSPARAMDRPAVAEADEPAPETAAMHMAQVCASDLRELLRRNFPVEAIQALALPLELIVKDRRSAAGLYTLQCGLVERLRDLPDQDAAAAVRGSLMKALEQNEACLRSLFLREASQHLAMADQVLHAELRRLHGGGGKRTAEAQGRLVRDLQAVCRALARGWDQVANWAPWTCWRPACGLERPALLEELTVGWLPAPDLPLPSFLRQVPAGPGEPAAGPGGILEHPQAGRLGFAEADWRERQAALRAGIPLSWLGLAVEPASPAPAPRAPAPQAGPRDGKDREAKWAAQRQRQQEMEARNREKNRERRQRAQARQAEAEAARQARLAAGVAEKARRADQSRRDRDRARAALAAKVPSAAPSAGPAPALPALPTLPALTVLPALPVPPALPLDPAPGEDLAAFRASDRYRAAFEALQADPARFAEWQDQLLARDLARLWGRAPERVRPGPARVPGRTGGAALDLRVPFPMGGAVSST